MMTLETPVEQPKRFTYDIARDLAVSIVRVLNPFCEKIEVVGSIRRRLASCKDVDIVVWPRAFEEFNINCNMFDQFKGRIKDRIFPEWEWKEDKHGKMRKLKKNHARNYLEYIIDDIPVEVWLANNLQEFEVIKLFRTGNSVFLRSLANTASRDYSMSLRLGGYHEFSKRPLYGLYGAAKGKKIEGNRKSAYETVVNPLHCIAWREEDIINKLLKKYYTPVDRSWSNDKMVFSVNSEGSYEIQKQLDRYTGIREKCVV